MGKTKTFRIFGITFRIRFGRPDVIYVDTDIDTDAETESFPEAKFFITISSRLFYTGFGW